MRYWERERVKYGARGERENVRELVFVGGKWTELDNRKGKEEKGVTWWETGSVKAESVRITVESH